MAVHDDILTAVKAALDALDVQGVPDAQVRDYPIVLGTEAPPLLYVAKAGEPRTVRTLMDRWVWRDYPAAVFLIEAGNRQVGPTAVAARATRQAAVLAALDRVTLAADAAGRVFHTQLDVLPVEGALLGSAYHVTAWQANYRVAERRAQ